MIQLPPHLNILLCVEPIDFRKGIDSLVALCKLHLHADPLSGTLFVFKNKSSTSLKLLVYDSQGYWLCLKRFSKGRIHWWPTPSDTSTYTLAAQQLYVLLYNGHPLHADVTSSDWRKFT
jgi:transposase